MEQYITFETAKTCKELGLDLPHTHYYVYPFRPAFKATGELMKNAVPDDYHNTMLQVVETRKNQPQIAPAYTQSVLQKYLRETHDIYVESYHDYDPKDGKYQYYTNWGFNDPNTIEKKQSGWYDEYNDWKKYEDALEFGLQQGLKLIPAKKK